LDGIERCLPDGAQAGTLDSPIRRVGASNLHWLLTCLYKSESALLYLFKVNLHCCTYFAFYLQCTNMPND
jgi:hypothetical protein